MCTKYQGTAFKACVHGSTISIKGVKIPCGSWACPECAKRKQIILGNRVKDGFSGCKIRFATLTARKGLSFVGMLRSLKTAWNILRGHLVRKYGLTRFFWVLEFGHDKGRPHLHFLFDCYIPQQSLSKLAAQSKWRDISEVTFEESDRYLLANLIYCEAGNQPYAGQVAVGAVVINRMRSAAYPNTMVGVIYQNRQFSPVASGRLAARLSVGANEQCYQAADDAMKGSTPVGNCLYFRTVIPEINGQIIGGHVFY